MENILFFKIRTTRIHQDFNTLKKADNSLACDFSKRHLNRADLQPEIYYAPEDNIANKFLNSAHFYPEYSKIICISLKILYASGEIKPIHSITCNKYEDYRKNEIVILRKFEEALRKKKIKFICGHNSNFYDLPYLRNKYLTYSENEKIIFPSILKQTHQVLHGNIIKKHPVWVVDKTFLDTAQIMKMLNGYTNFSLNTTLAMFGIENTRSKEFTEEPYLADFIFDDYQKGNISKVKEDNEKCVLLIKSIYDKLLNSYK